jgi:exonuclease 1
MGIEGLWKHLVCFSERMNIQHFRHQSIAVDASSWLHRSVISMSEVFAEKTERSPSHRDASLVRVSSAYMRKRCQELILGARVRKIVLVFDGKRCPLKAETDEVKDDIRQRYLNDARIYKKHGLRTKSEKRYKKSIKIHPSFVDAVAKQLQQMFAQDRRVQFVFSPYEADAQLVRLCVDKEVDAVITGDSDVLVYSVTCDAPFPIIYDLDRKKGDCKVLNMNWLLRPSPQSRQISANNNILQSLVDIQHNSPGLGARLFVQSCVLAGSDYSPRKQYGIGIVKAFTMLTDSSHQPCHERLRHVLAKIQENSKGSEDLDVYETLLSQSESIFYYHLVLNDKNKLSYLNAPRLLNRAVKNEIDYRPILDRDHQNLWFLGDVLEQRLILNPDLQHNTMISLPKMNKVVREKEALEQNSSNDFISDNSAT